MKLTKKEILDEYFTRYDLEIEGTHNFVAENVVVHNTSVRTASIWDGDQHLLFCGSKNHPRKRPGTNEEMLVNFYWFPWTIYGVRDFINDYEQCYKTVEIFGETYGRVQSLRYGLTGIAYACFAIKIDGKYVDFDERVLLCTKYNIPMVPVLYRGPFSLEKIKEISEGNTVMADIDQIREGTVVQPTKERRDPRIGRCVLKYVSDTYLFGKHAEKDTTDA